MTAHVRWPVVVALQMGLSLCFTLFGTIPFFSPAGVGGPMAGVRDAALLILWSYGIAGLFVGFLQDPPKKMWFALTGFGWTITALAWGLLRYQCPFNVWCEYDTSGNENLLPYLGVALGVLLLYHRYQAQLPPLLRRAVHVSSMALLTLWLAVPVFTIAASIINA